MALTTVCSSTAAYNQDAGIATSGRRPSDATGALRTFTLAQSSSTTYSLNTTPPASVLRWGDYSQTVVDPSDDMTMWTFQEYCDATNSWGVRVLQLLAPPPATPASASPSSIAQGAAGNLVLTGTAVGGSGFFDPGPGFPNRLAAAVNGG